MNKTGITFILLMIIILLGQIVFADDIIIDESILNIDTIDVIESPSTFQYDETLTPYEQIHQWWDDTVNLYDDFDI
jgi:hypothetical protein